MSLEITPIKPKTANMISYRGDEFSPVEVFDTLIHSTSERGWEFSAGDPEFWKFSDRLLVQGGKALDIGIGIGRSSMYLALNGMNVTGIDSDRESNNLLRELALQYDLPISIQDEDFNHADFGHEQYDTVILAQSLFHSPSKKHAFEVLDRAIDAVKPGGHLWFRTGGKYDSSYANFAYESQGMWSTIERIDEDTFEAPCSCSGDLKIERHLFLDPIEVMVFFTERGMRIPHSEIIPTEWKPNILFGEDWQRHNFSSEVGGMITVLAQKPVKR